MLTDIAMRTAAPRRYQPGVVTVDPDPDPTKPAFPTASAGFTAAWGNTFAINCPYGNFADAAAGYTGTYVNSLTNGQMHAFSAAGLDTRHNRASCAARTMTGCSWGTTDGHVTGGQWLSTDVGRLVVQTGIPSFTTVSVFNNSADVVLSATPTVAGVSTTLNITGDYGKYAPEQISVADGIMTFRMITTPDGIHRSVAVTPVLSPTTSQYVVGGEFVVVAKIPAPIPRRKRAWLWWPKVGSNVSGTTAPSPPGTGLGGNGEMDFPEDDEIGGVVRAFTHYQDGTGGQYSDTSSLTNAGDNIWHEYRTRWLPNADRVSSSIEYLLDGVRVGLHTGFNVPNQLMHWVLQTESSLSTSVISPLPDGGILQIGSMMYATAN